MDYQNSYLKGVAPGAAPRKLKREALLARSLSTPILAKRARERVAGWKKPPMFGDDPNLLELKRAFP